ncbi:MAG: arginine--tRNA ligase [Thermodesulfovibrionales bacterium]|nr:arginine--tRNA ligase [Thermodesulfovibrionales bacterium]
MIEAIEELEKIIKEIAPVSSVEIEIPPDENMGDIATPQAMSLAKLIKKPPKEIASEIIKRLSSRFFQSAEIAGPGFINLRFSKDYLYNWMRRMAIGDESALLRKKDSYQKINVEFVSANPTGPLHLGHGRGAATGMAIVNILRRAGYSVTAEYYINDAGRQVSLFGESVFARYKELLGAAYPFPEEGYRGEYVKDIASRILKDIGPAYRDSSFNEVAEFFIKTSVSMMMERIKEDLNAFGVFFDSYQSEAELYRRSDVQKSLDALKSKHYIYEKDGALWFASSRFGDDKDRVLRKSDGDYTYFTSDIAYHKNKIDRGFDLLINIWGADHHGYIPRLRAVLRALDYPEERLKVYLVQMVNLLRSGKPVQMSKRAGEFVTLREIMDEVGTDTTKFIFLTRSPDSHLDFDIEVAKRQSPENPVYYVQYAHARVKSIFRYAVEQGIDLSRVSQARVELLDLQEETRLIKKLIFYPFVFEVALRTLEPHRITFYLQELAGLFHSYYNKYRFITDDRDLTLARLCLAEVVGIILKEGLEILGVKAPERM